MSISVQNIEESTAVSPIDVAAAVKGARDAVGYSIEDLAVTCGLANGEILEIENGESADPAKLRRIATALQVPVSAFLHI